MSRPFLPPIVSLVLLLVALASSPAAEVILNGPFHSPGRHAAAVGVKDAHAQAPSAVGCSRSAAAASRVVAESCTNDIVRSFFGVRGRDICCRALKVVGAGCYRAVFSGSPFADIYPTILASSATSAA